MTFVGSGAGVAGAATAACGVGGAAGAGEANTDVGGGEAEALVTLTHSTQRNSLGRSQVPAPSLPSSFLSCL